MREALRDPLRLRHMLNAICKVEEFMHGKDMSDLENESLLFFGVVKNIEIIGEAAYKLTHEFKDAHSEIPWKQIVAMRHVLVHGYYQVATDEIYNIYSEDLPILKDKLTNIIPQSPE